MLATMVACAPIAGSAQMAVGIPVGELGTLTCTPEREHSNGPSNNADGRVAICEFHPRNGVPETYAALLRTIRNDPRSPADAEVVMLAVKGPYAIRTKPGMLEQSYGAEDIKTPDKNLPLVGEKNGAIAPSGADPGKEAKLSYIGNALTENRHGLVVEAELGCASGTTERAAAKRMIVRHSPGAKRVTLGADKAHDAAEFVADLRQLHVTPHVAQNDRGRRSAIDKRTTRHPGYAISQQKRKRTEEPFGWGKTIGGLARPMLRGAKRLAFKFTLTMAGYDLVRLPKLLAAPA